MEIYSLAIKLWDHVNHIRRRTQVRNGHREDNDQARRKRLGWGKRKGRGEWKRYGLRRSLNYRGLEKLAF